MLEILRSLIDSLRGDRTVAYTSIVETKGSTPQKPGATMLIFPDGSQQGTLGGGCVEAEVKRKALKLLDERKREILTFQLDEDYGWDDGLICGGRMRILVDPVFLKDDLPYFQTLEELLTSGGGCTEAVVIDSEKKNVGQNADRFLFDRQNRLVTSRGSAREPAGIEDRLKPLANRPRSYVLEGISFLTHLKSCRLVIVGGGHVGQKVAELAAQSDFEIWVVDDREQYCNPQRFPQAKRLIVGDIDTSLSGLEIDCDTYCIIVTRGHHHDEEALYHLAETAARYVGMIGSRRKIKLIYEDLLRDGISRDALEKVQAPLGIDIGSQTVPEIAVSIVAELIAHRNCEGLPEPLKKPPLVHEIQPKVTP